MLVSSRAYFERIYLSLVEVVNQVLNDSGGVGGLDALTVVGNDGARGSAGHDDTLLTLKRKHILAPISRGDRVGVTGRSRLWVLTFLPYRLRSSALIVTNFSPAMEKPLAKALSAEV